MIKNKENIDKFIEIVNRSVSPKGHVDWSLVQIECNTQFGEESSSNSWRKRFERISKKITKQEIKMPHNYENDKKNMIDLLSKAMSISVLEKKINLTKYEILGLIKEINDEGLYQIVEGLNGYQVNKNQVGPKQVYQHSFGELTKKSIMVISDSHMGSIYELVDYLVFVYKEAKKRGITEVYHIGDISDGYYTNRPEQIYSLKCIGFDAQVDNIIANYPKEEGITTYFILGNHDETHIRNGGANLGIAVSRDRSDMKYLGIGSARVMLTPNCSMDLLHPLDGSSYALSYSGQKYMDALTGGDKPNILVVGHHHKAMYMFYRNIHYYEVPSTCLQSSWEKRKRINNTAGAWILNIEVDSQGTVTSITNELIPHYVNKK
jgi:UDP-2,3-diacylglucosamine pyrophosphatase LpxH